MGAESHDVLVLDFLDSEALVIQQNVKYAQTVILSHAPSLFFTIEPYQRFGAYDISLPQK